MVRNILWAAGAFSLLAVTLWSCSRGSEERITVASETRNCYGVGIQQCMLVKHNASEPWTFFYGNIEGFDYVPGYEYVLEVKKEEVKNPPADASSIRYGLVKIVSREKKTSENMPPDAGD